MVQIKILQVDNYQVIEDNPTGKIDDNVDNDTKQDTSVPNDDTKTKAKNYVFAYLSSKGFNEVWFREVRKKAMGWKYIKPFLQILGVVGVVFTIYYQKLQQK